MSKKPIGAILLLLVGAGCASQDKSLYPLKEGEKWKYQLSAQPAGGGNATMQLIITNMPKREVEGISVTPQKLEINGSTSFAFIKEDSTGVIEVANQGSSAVEPEIINPPKYYLHLPIKKGEHWERQSQTVLFDRNVSFKVDLTVQETQETVTTPAGTFQDCVKVAGKGKASNALSELFGKTDVSIEETTWYCPGVGVVRQLTKETAKSRFHGGGEISLQLESHGKEA
jgi:hypothetical protein